MSGNGSRQIVWERFDLFEGGKKGMKRAGPEVVVRYVIGEHQPLDRHRVSTRCRRCADLSMTAKQVSRSSVLSVWSVCAHVFLCNEIQLYDVISNAF